MILGLKSSLNEIAPLMEGPVGYLGLYSQNFRSLGQIRENNENFVAAILNFAILALNKYIFLNIDIINQFFDLEM